MSFDIAKTGLRAASMQMGTAAHNIANSNTSGFKRSRAEQVESNPAAHGTRTSNIQQLHQQGSFEYTGNNFDLSISGRGFFQLADGDKTVYSRQGSFHADREGYIVNEQGQRLQGYNSSGQIGDLKLAENLNAPKESTRVEIDVNVDAKSEISKVPFDPSDLGTFSFQTSTTVYDSQGQEHELQVSFAKSTTPGQWQVHSRIDGNIVDTQTVDFDSAGQLSNPPNGELTLPNHDTGNGADPLELKLDLSRTTQYGSESSANSIRQDGYAAASVSGFTVDASGKLSTYSANGEQQSVGQIALADFANPTGLQQLGNSQYGQTLGSGDTLTGVAGSGNLGELHQGSLEASNVQLDDEFINMKQASIQYQANAKVIGVENQMLGYLLDKKA